MNSYITKEDMWCTGFDYICNNESDELYEIINELESEIRCESIYKGESCYIVVIEKNRLLCCNNCKNILTKLIKV